MRSFDSFGAFEAHLLVIAGATKIALHEGVKRAADEVQKIARAEIGVYQDGIGTSQGGIGAIPPWAQLAESTERRKEIMGFPLDSPLLAIGEFRDSITRQVDGLKAVVGSDDERGLWFEIGTTRDSETGTVHMPPRPVFAPAAIRAEEKVLRILEEAAAIAIVAGDWQHMPLGSDHSD